MNRKMKIGIIITVVLTSGLLVAQAYAQKRAERMVSKYIEAVADKTVVEVGDIKANLFSGSMTLKNVRSTPLSFPVIAEAKEVVIRDYEEGKQIPEELEVSVRGLAIELPPSAELLGYNRLNLDLDLDYILKEGKILDVRKLRIAGPGSFEVEANLQMEHMSEATPPIGLHSADFIYSDRSMMPRLFAAVTKKNYDPAAAVQMMDMIIAGAQAEGESPRMIVALGEIKKFVSDPGRISFTMRPNAPIAIKDIQTAQPGKLLDLLNISVEYQKI